MTLSPGKQTSDTVEGVLYRAIDIIHEVGWCRGKLRDEQGRVCLEGAVKTAVINEGTSPKWVKLAPDKYLLFMNTLKRVGEVVGCPGMFVSGWNDCSAVSADDVIDVFKRAIDLGEIA